MQIGRREFVSGALLMGLMARTAEAKTASLRQPAFSRQTVVDLARQAAAKPFIVPDETLAQGLNDLSYDAYRKIQFLHPQALWAGDNLAFRIEFFHRGGLYKPKVDLFEVVSGQVTPLTYRPEQFLYDPPLETALAPDIGFAGFRIVSQNGIDLDEMVSFLGASYFRALGRGQQYGQSARGLAIATGNAGGEEFPLFRAFWIEKPAKGETSLRVHALLDSPSLTGAFTFLITPGTATVFDVETLLFPRKAIDRIGIAPLTSMYLFDAAHPGAFDDYRAAVHDSDGLQIVTGANEAIWRPLNNPPRVEESAFLDLDPAGFGLIQRKTKSAAFSDDDANYHLRPSAWVTPIGPWGKGAVHLFELPTRVEAADNIVAFWRPDAPLMPGQAYAYRYELTWGRPEIAPATKAKTLETRTGRALNMASTRQFLVDFAVPATEIPQLTAKLTASSGTVGIVRLQAIAAPDAVRASFLFTPPPATGAPQDADLQLALYSGETAVSETWMFRWTT